MSAHRSSLRSIVTAALMAVGIGLAVAPTRAHAAACNGPVPYDHYGALDFLDYAPNGDHARNDCGSVYENNPTWQFARSWGGRADRFRNNKAGFTAWIYARVYYDSEYRTLAPGESTLWYDQVDSNQFTQR